jgi:membrane-associated protein
VFLTLATLIHISSRAGYLAVFGLITIETMGVPVPGETALIAGSLAAHKGSLDIGVLIAVAAAAAIIGDNVGFFIGRRYGRRVFMRPGVWHDQRLALLDMGEPFFAKHGPKAVFLGRWVSGLRIASSWLAGMNQMRWPVFTFWNALGGIAWATGIGLGAYFAGDAFIELISRAGVAGGVVVVVAVVGIVWWRHRHHTSGLKERGAAVRARMEAETAADDGLTA